MRGAWVEITLKDVKKEMKASLPVRGAWVEIEAEIEYCQNDVMSLPVRGAWVEIQDEKGHIDITMSLPVRGAWVEIPKPFTDCIKRYCRSPCGERGLKSYITNGRAFSERRSPCGERGLKSQPSPLFLHNRSVSLPVRGAWVEISVARSYPTIRLVAPRAGSVG